MSSRFVSSGAIDLSSGERVEAAPAENERLVGKNTAEWEAVQKEVEEQRKRREEVRKQEEAGEQKSLYDILQANKAAKQAAFEEKTKIRNQFRALDDDEIDFLDEVRASKRAEEERLRRETEEGLRVFREARKSGSKEEEEEDAIEIGEDWEVGRKRKRAKEKDSLVKGVRRRVSGLEEMVEVKEVREESKAVVVGDKRKMEDEVKKVIPSALVKPKLGGLVDYGSDDDDDE